MKKLHEPIKGTVSVVNSGAPTTLGVYDKYTTSVIKAIVKVVRTAGIGPISSRLKPIHSIVFDIVEWEARFEESVLVKAAQKTELLLSIRRSHQREQVKLALCEQR